MKLIIRVVSEHQYQMGADAIKEFSTAGGTIGRAGDNLWVLPDPERYISSRHAEVVHQNGEYYLKDISSNGVVIVDTDMIIGRDNQVRLENGQEFLIGDYQIRVEMEEMMGGASPMPTGSTVEDFTASQNQMDDFFGVSNDPLELLGGQSGGMPSAGAGVAPEMDPASSMAATMERTPAFRESMQVGGGHMPDFSSQAHSAAPASPTPGGAGCGIPEDWDMTGFSMPEKSPAAPAPSVAPQSVAPAVPADPFDDPFDSDPFAGMQPPAPAVAPESVAPEVPVHAESQTPAVTPEPVVPDIPPVDMSDMAGAGGDSDLMALLSSDESAPAAEPQPAMPQADVSVAAAPPAQPSTPVVADPVVAAPVAEPTPPVPPAQPAQAPAAARPTLDRAKPNRTRANRGDERSAPGQVGRADAAMLERVRASFQEQNINPELMTAEVAEEWLTLMPLLMGGVLDLLHARAAIKNEFRVNKTILHSMENNPLKFSTNAEDGIVNLFHQKRSGFLDSQAAFAQALNDINVHQSALLQGVRVGMMDLLRRFEPEVLEKQFDQGLKRGSLLNKMNSSKYWQLYKELYEDFQVDSDDDFHRIFGQTFALAYDEYCTQNE